jgi:hypothetical protein
MYRMPSGWSRSAAAALAISMAEMSTPVTSGFPAGQGPGDAAVPAGDVEDTQASGRSQQVEQGQGGRVRNGVKAG